MEINKSFLLSNDSDGNQNIEVIVKYYGDILRLEMELGVDVELLNENYAIISILPSQVDSLYNYREVEYIEMPKVLTYMLNQELNSTCIRPVQSETGNNLRGKGTIIGIMDSGIDYTHRDFRNADGTSRILYIWDQSITSNPPDGFKIGTEYTNAQINEALAQDNPFAVIGNLDVIGHGTAVAGVACGNGATSNGLDIGVAPEANIIVVKLGQSRSSSFAKTTEIMRALKYLIDKASGLNMPIAINISFGTNNGAHNGNSLFESYISDMALRWKNVIVVATGNEGGTGQHFYAEIKQGAVINSEFVVPPNMKNIYVTLWKDFVDTFNFEIIAPNGLTTGIIRNVNSLTQFIFNDTILYVDYGSPNHYSVLQEIYLYIESPKSILEGIWEIRITGVDVVNGSFNIWLPTIAEVGTTSFLRPNADITLTLPSTSRNILSVGAYNSRNTSIAPFSGKGYTNDIVYIKPDIVAPGVGVMTVRSGGGYDSFSGTSIATPFVTGAAALIMQWGIVEKNDVFLYGEKVKAFLQKGANRVSNVSYPNRSWGYGTLCLKQTMDFLVNYNRKI